MKPLPDLNTRLHEILDLCMQINALGDEHAHLDVSPHVGCVYVNIYPANHVYNGLPAEHETQCAHYAHYQLINWDHISPADQTQKCQQQLDDLVAVLHSHIKPREVAA